ncbi:UNVERIFIED_CONTAM: hypothetical protein FKN15_077710 [Acipenser sinensis]
MTLTVLWLQKQLSEMIQEYRSFTTQQARYSDKPQSKRKKLFDDIAVWFGAGNSVLNTINIEELGHSITDVAHRAGKGIQHSEAMYTNQAVMLQGEAITEILTAVEIGVYNIDQGVSCKLFARDMLDVVRA